MMNYNKGCWSEAYAFVKLLGEGKVHAADKDLNKNLNEYYPILKIIRKEIEKLYLIDDSKSVIQLTDLEGNIKKEIPTKQFLEIADLSLPKIIEGKGRSFPIPVLENFLNGLEIINFKASSQDKPDLNMEIVDLDNNISKEFTFSVKSELGSKATILNASKATNFIYKLDNISESEVEEINNINKETDGNRNWLKNRMSAILDKTNNNDYSKLFLKTENEFFSSNLRLIDSNLPLIVSDLLIDYYGNKGISSVENLTERLIKRNPLNLTIEESRLFYKTKVIQLIKAATLGMMPSIKWDNEYSVTGGILTVKKNGDILCHHIFYNKDALDEYLYRNTKLETGSTTRYNQSDLTYLNGSAYFTLNLQVRMK